VPPLTIFGSGAEVVLNKLVPKSSPVARTVARSSVFALIFLRARDALNN